MNRPKERPFVVVSPPSFGDKSYVVFAIGSEFNPLAFIEKLSCDPSTGEWKWTVIPPPLEGPHLKYVSNVVLNAGFAKIAGNRKLLISTLHGLLIFDMDTNMWDCNFEHLLSTYAAINDYGTYNGQVPVVDSVWYVCDRVEDNKVFGFDLQTFKWSQVYNLAQDKYQTHSLVQIGDKSMGVVCIKKGLEPTQCEVYCTVFEVQKGLDGSLHACNQKKTPSYFFDGQAFIHCVVLETDQDTECGSSIVLKKRRIECGR
ncbi:hypothetical protein FRX31_016295 [Thalictrum thalictroides]|uniref:Uncharacterized protein n=1 Tax=Thalictrum thalictroides TaxID=46969 RepID=A0A7J6WBZ4_THATH|nr:hypothetical protein FRX31_016295 [Thalictrum thalictroides]